MGEVARLMQQIEIECEAMKLAMIGFRMTASHDIINRQYERLGEHYESLGKLIGEKQAVEVVIATLDIALEKMDSIDDSARTSNVSAGDGETQFTLPGPESLVLLRQAIRTNSDLPNSPVLDESLSYP